MPTPDLTPYVDLRFFDKDPQDVFDGALVELQSNLPEWTPREGNIEVLLLEAMALQVAEAIFAVNRLPGAVIMALLKLFGIDPDEGTPPTAMLKFTVSDATGQEIPEGTSARLDLTEGLEPVVFTTEEPLSIPAGSTVGQVLATGDRYTDEGNGVIAGTRLELIDAVYFVDKVELGTTSSGGVDPEEDEDWIERGVQRFGRLTEAYVLPRHFEIAMLEDARVLRARALDNFNSEAGSGAVGSHPGHVTVAVYGKTGALSAAVKAELDATLEAGALANLSTHVTDPTVTAVNVTTTVVADQGFSPATVTANVTAALQAYLSVATWDWSSTVRRNALIQVIGSAEGVAYVSALTPDDTALPGAAPLATLGTLAVTVS